MCIFFLMPLSALQDAAGSLVCPAPVSESPILQRPWFLLLETSVRNQGLGAGSRLLCSPHTPPNQSWWSLDVLLSLWHSLFTHTEIYRGLPATFLTRMFFSSFIWLKFCPSRRPDSKRPLFQDAFLNLQLDSPQPFIVPGHEFLKAALWCTCL